MSKDKVIHFIELESIDELPEVNVKDIEKLLKANVVKKSNDHAPFTHDLTKLASLTKFEFTEEHLDWLDTITTFNINARYDSYKHAFNKKCTPIFTHEWIEKIKQLRQWIKTKQ